MAINEEELVFFEVINKKFYILEQRYLPSKVDETEVLEALKEQYSKETEKSALTAKGNLTKAFSEWMEEKKEKDDEDDTEEKEKDDEDDSIAWVYQDERDAIEKINELMADENLDLDENLDDITDYLSFRYNLQEIEITEDKYNMKAISWLKIALIGLANK